MRDIRHKFFLIIFLPGDSSSHIVEAGGEISHLIPAVGLYLIMIISLSVLFRTEGDLSERPVDKLVKEQQDNKRKHK